MAETTPIRIEQLAVPVQDMALLPLLWHKGSPWIDDIKNRLEGKYEGSLDRFFVAYDGPRIVAHVWTAVAQRDPRVGLLGHVFTRPEYRQQGLSSRLIEAALGQFARDGGQVMQLFTYNPDTLRFYERFGFEMIHASQVQHSHDWSMRRPAGSGPLVASWFASGPCTLRPLAPGDLPRYCLLYNMEYQTNLKDRAQKIGLGLEAECAFIITLERLQRGQGVCLALENRDAIVGIATLMPCDFPHQSHVGLVDFYVYPQFSSHANKLLQSALAEKDRLGVELIYALSVDEAKQKVFAAAGLKPCKRLEKHYKVEGQFLDCELYQL